MHFGLSLGLRHEPRYEQRLAQECRVCRQFFGDGHETLVHAALVGLAARRYAICPCCGQVAPDPTDRNYRARARRWLRKYRA